jgi:hypothetical protein
VRFGSLATQLAVRDARRSAAPSRDLARAQDPSTCRWDDGALRAVAQAAVLLRREVGAVLVQIDGAPEDACPDADVVRSALFADPSLDGGPFEVVTSR